MTIFEATSLTPKRSSCKSLNAQKWGPP